MVMINLECVNAGGKQKRIAPMWLRKWIEKGRMVMPSHPINDRQRKKIEYQLFTGKG
jgi:hypothetical protein